MYYTCPMEENIKIIETISNKEKSEVYLVHLENDTMLYILKKYHFKGIEQTYDCIMNMNSPYLPKIMDVWDEDGYVCVLEEYIPGKNLREVIEEGNIPKAKVKKYMLMICEALRSLHDNDPKLVHRDVKPENIIVNKDDVIKLIDFDITRVYKPDNEYDTVLMGTRGYTSPEQFGYRQTDERSDIYSAGIVLKELVDASPDKGAHSGLADKIINKATMFDPDKRYASICNMKRDVERMYRMRDVVILLTISLMLIVLTGLLFYNIMPGDSDNVQDNAQESSLDYSRFEDERLIYLNQGLWYHLEDGYCVFWGIPDEYSCPEKIYLVQEVGGVPMTEIGKMALAGKKEIKELHIPSSVTKIYEDSFHLCEFIVYGEKGSYAEEFCNEYGYRFVEEDH